MRLPQRLHSVRALFLGVCFERMVVIYALQILSLSHTQRFSHRENSPILSTYLAGEGYIPLIGGERAGLIPANPPDQ